MAVSCEAKCGKSVLLSFTLIHWLAGTALILLGASIMMDPAKLHIFRFVTFDTSEREYGLYLSYGLLVIGGLIFLISWAGCCGAIRENRCLLVAYFIFLMLLMIVEIGGSSLTLYYRKIWLKDLEFRLRETLIVHYGNTSTHEKYLTFTEALDFTQYKFGCCGITNHTDYQKSIWRKKNRGFPEDKDIEQSKYTHLVPLTCCILKSPTEPWVASAASPMSTLQRDTPHGTVEEQWQSPNVANQTKCQLPKNDEDFMLRHKKGCHPIIDGWFHQESTILITVGFVTAILQMLGIILTICLCCNLEDDI